MAKAWLLMSRIRRADGTIIRLSSRLYEQAKLQVEHAQHGMFAARDQDGIIEYIHRDDSRFVSGEPVALSKGRTGYQHTEEAKEKGSIAKQATKNPNHKWYVTTPLGKFNSLGEAANAHGISRVTVQRRCRNPNYPNWVFSEDDIKHIIPDISLDEIKANNHNRNKTTYKIIDPHGNTVHEICGFFRDFCVDNGLSHPHALKSCRTGNPVGYKDPNHKWYGHTVVKLNSSTPSRKEYKTSNTFIKNLIVTDAGGDILYTVYGTLVHLAEHIGVTVTALRSAFNNKTPMFNGTNGKTYSKKVPHLYHATIREATPDEISTLSWEILERIVVR